MPLSRISLRTLIGTTFLLIPFSLTAQEITPPSWNQPPPSSSRTPTALSDQAFQAQVQKQGTLVTKQLEKDVKEQNKANARNDLIPQNQTEDTNALQGTNQPPMTDSQEPPVFASPPPSPAPSAAPMPMNNTQEQNGDESKNKGAWQIQY